MCVTWWWVHSLNSIPVFYISTHWWIHFSAFKNYLFLFWIFFLIYILSTSFSHSVFPLLSNCTLFAYVRLCVSFCLFIFFFSLSARLFAFVSTGYKVVLKFFLIFLLFLLFSLSLITKTWKNVVLHSQTHGCTLVSVWIDMLHEITSPVQLFSRSLTHCSFLFFFFISLYSFLSHFVSLFLFFVFFRSFNFFYTFILSLFLPRFITLFLPDSLIVFLHLLLFFVYFFGLLFIYVLIKNKNDIFVHNKLPLMMFMQ